MLEKSPTTIDRTAIEAAAELIRPHVRRTPVLAADAEEFGIAPTSLVFKLELLQHTGSFKPRGAFNNLLTRDVPAAGVAAASGGNHGAAVAYAARKLGAKATIFVPSISSPAKLERIRAYGADLVVGGERYVDALAASEAFAARTGALPVHAYDQAETMVGQGTRRPGARGGRAGHRHAARRGRRRRADRRHRRLVSAAASGSSASSRKRRRRCTWRLQAGEPVDAPAGGIAADSLAPRRVGALMFPHRAGPCRARRAGRRRGDRRGAACACGTGCGS